ncbi:MAG TPA: hypothetical protein VK791_04095 [bacterium]|jgi:hypothetical protein|nr:hypothetical protein [bacterium]
MEKTPKHHGEFYFEPEPAQWRNAVLQNRDKFFNIPLWGQKAAKVREHFKMPTDCPVVLTGHQPIFFYPGIWAKCLAASQLALSVSGVAYHKLTDTALSPEFTHFIPEINEKGKAHRREVDFFISKDAKAKERSTPYAFLPAPDEGALKKILSDLEAFGPASAHKSVKYFEDKLIKGLKVNSSWDQFHSHSLDLLDQIDGNKRTTLVGSQLWASEPFLNFVTYWLIHMTELGEQYNESLNEYRKKNGITHDIEPVPNLKFEDWYFETPFWGSAKSHHRDTIWAKTDGKKVTLKVKGVEGHHDFLLDDLKNQLNASPLKIWPKAIPQTLFCRMYLCDFFIHGIGGGVYEEVVDLFFKKTTQVDPPAYGIVSATYLVDFKESAGLDVIVNHEKILGLWERALEQNPEYLFTREADWKRDVPSFMHGSFDKCLQTESLRKLADEKKEAVNSLKDPAKRAQAAKRIKEINLELFANYGEVLAAIQQGILDAQAVKETRDVLAFREYPFFCFEPEVFTDMKEKIRRAFAEGWK